DFGSRSIHFAVATRRSFLGDNVVHYYRNDFSLCLFGNTGLCPRIVARQGGHDLRLVLRICFWYGGARFGYVRGISRLEKHRICLLCLLLPAVVGGGSGLVAQFAPVGDQISP